MYASFLGPGGGDAERRHAQGTIAALGEELRIRGVLTTQHWDYGRTPCIVTRSVPTLEDRGQGSAGAPSRARWHRGLYVVECVGRPPASFATASGDRLGPGRPAAASRSVHDQGKGRGVLGIAMALSNPSGGTARHCRAFPIRESGRIAIIRRIEQFHGVTPWTRTSRSRCSGSPRRRPLRRQPEAVIEHIGGVVRNPGAARAGDRRAGISGVAGREPVIDRLREGSGSDRPSHRAMQPCAAAPEQFRRSSQKDCGRPAPPANPGTRR